MTRYKFHSARVDPAPSPLPADIQDSIDAVMRGNEPLVLFTTLARDRRLFFKLFNAGLLDHGHPAIRQREIVIDRVTAQCGAEYEWGVHVAGVRRQGRAGRTADRITRERRCRRGHGAMRTAPSSALRQLARLLHRRR